jgi:hypothetical protein
VPLRKSIYHFFFSESDPITLAVFRIVMGIFIFVMLLALFPNWQTYYGPGGVRPEPAIPTPESLFILTEGWIPISLFWWIGILSSIALIVGWNTRFFTIVLFFLQTSMNHANSMMVNGEDLILRMLLFYSIFAPLGATLSLDSRYYRSNFSIWPLRLMQINIALIYFFSLPVKLRSDISWLNGEAIYWVMMTSTWSRWSWQQWFYDGTLSKILTYSTVLVEGSFPFLIWFKKTRMPILIAISLFHIGLGVGLKNVSFFSFSMVCAFILFIPPKNIRNLIKYFQNSNLGKRFAYTYSNQTNNLEA